MFTITSDGVVLLGRTGFYILCIYSDASFSPVVNDSMNNIDPTLQRNRYFNCCDVYRGDTDGRTNQIWAGYEHRAA